MEDLFGHRRQKKTEENLSVSLESHSEFPGNHRSIKSHGRSSVLFSTFVPRIEGYELESLNELYASIPVTDVTQFEKLRSMSPENYEKASKNMYVELADLMPRHFDNTRAAVHSVGDLSRVLIDDILQSISEVCDGSLDGDVVKRKFKDVSYKLTGLLDDIFYERETNGLLHHRDEKSTLKMVQMDFDECVVTAKEALVCSADMDKMILNIVCKVENIKAHLIRINMVYDQYTEVGRPTRGALTRFCKDIERIYELLRITLHLLNRTSEFMNTMITRLDDQDA